MPQIGHLSRKGLLIVVFRLLRSANTAYLLRKRLPSWAGHFGGLNWRATQGHANLYTFQIVKELGGSRLRFTRTWRVKALTSKLLLDRHKRQPADSRTLRTGHHLGDGFEHRCLVGLQLYADVGIALLQGFEFGFQAG